MVILKYTAFVTQPNTPMQVACNISESLPASGHSHVTSRDPQHLNSALHDVLARPAVQKALRSAYRVDFELYNRSKAHQPQWQKIDYTFRVFNGPIAGDK